jgi:hypothetical protein
MNKDIEVQISLSLKFYYRVNKLIYRVDGSEGVTFLRGCSTSGRMPMTGLTRSMSLTRYEDDIVAAEWC